MRASFRFLLGVGLLGLGSLAGACAATSEPNEFDEYDDDDGDGGAGGELSGGGGTDVVVGSTTGTSGNTTTGSGPGPIPTTLTCPGVAQDILVLDFRSGWWSGGGGGDFGQIPLQVIANTCNGATVEYHHFEVSFRVKCLYSTNGGPGCEQIDEEPPMTTDGVLALFEKPFWDDYTQVWILSGSELDATDVSLTGALFDHFLQQTKGSCLPVLIGAGDGFITHGNAVAVELGLGNVFSTEFVQPGFFSVAIDPNVKVDSRMQMGSQLEKHVLFQDVSSIADEVSTGFQQTHGDAIAEQPGVYDVIGYDNGGRASIAVGDIELPGGDDRPFILDSGFQRFYDMGAPDGTQGLLQNFVKYLGSVGCKAEPPK